VDIAKHGSAACAKDHKKQGVHMGNSYDTHACREQNVRKTNPCSADLMRDKKQQERQVDKALKGCDYDFISNHYKTSVSRLVSALNVAV
jgi:hypothetical protein